MVKDRIIALQQQMQLVKIDAIIISSSDPHLSEFTAPHWQSRQWFSGFTGSAGLLVVTLQHVALWVDGRYFIQAEEELLGSNIELMKQGLSATPTINEWLHTKLKDKATIGFDGSIFATEAAKNFLKLANNKKNFSVKTNIDLLDKAWQQRPEKPKNKTFVHPMKYAGESVKDKISKTRKRLTELKATATIISSLDEIAWITNMRGADIAYNPVFLSFMFISLKEIIIFADKSIFGAIENKHLQDNNIKILPYNSLKEFINKIKTKHTFALDKQHTNFSIFEAINSKFNLINHISPIVELKAIKSSKEISQMQQCHIADGTAVVKLIYWIKQQIATNNKITEISIADKATEIRSLNSDFIFCSFPAIVAYAKHGAICHYQASIESNLKINKKGLLLIDSGGQYLNGTTDITRTLVCNKINKQEKTDYTMVLKSHIALANCSFPKNCTGIQLDSIARSVLWNKKINFNHGTGHGVGYFLYVHEGPHSISPKATTTTIKPGMLITNEPGIYREAKHGIRLENIMLVVKDCSNEFGEFYKLQPLTLAPFDKDAIDASMLTEQEKYWLNNYHRDVYNQLHKYLSKEEKFWLKQQTSKIN